MNTKMDLATHYEELDMKIKIISAILNGTVIIKYSWIDVEHQIDNLGLDSRYIQKIRMREVCQQTLEDLILEFNQLNEQLYLIKEPIDN
jgi:hypothetical protein